LKKKLFQNLFLRPIGARALKSAGDSLRPFLPGTRVLDLYAGQGRFGSMALHERAENVVFVERDEHTGAQLRLAVQRHAGKTTVYVRDVFEFLGSHAHDKFDLVFADPPFKEWKEGFGLQLASAVVPVLAPNSIFLVKNPSRVVLSAPLPGLILWKQSKFGESTLTYYRYGA
jgi:16S rRNA (guanine966-N2)-methyltransferase